MHRRSSGFPYTPYTIPSWLYEVFSRNINDLKLKIFTRPLTTPSTILEEYLTAIQAHDSCNFCLRVHAKKGSTFCAGLERKLAQARDKVHTSADFKVLEGSPPCRWAVIVANPRAQLIQALGLGGPPDSVMLR